MVITKRSPLTGSYITRDIANLTQDALDLWQSGTAMDKALEAVAEEDRTFILTGLAPEELAGVVREKAPDAAFDAPVEAAVNHGN